RGKALVRTVHLGGHGGSTRRLAVAALPLGTDDEGRPWGILGVADPETKSFGLTELELLSRIAQRLTSYVRARQEVRSHLGGAGDPAAEHPSTGGPPHVKSWWKVEPAAAPPFPPPAGAVVAPRAPEIPETEPHGTAVPEATSSPASNGTGDELPIILEQQAVSGLLSLGGLLGRAGRLLGAGDESSGSLVVVALDVAGGTGPAEGVVLRVAGALRAQLRFDDPAAQVGASGFVAVLAVAPGGPSAVQVEERLASSVREAIGPDAVVRSAHEATDLTGKRDADDLVRAAVRKLRAG
ncbi:MAG: hypothetical protein ACRDV8_13915, partial [Acidimicrobiales bacterium]